jgi:archaellum component FlaC
MAKIQAHIHSNISKINSYCRNLRQKNTAGINGQQQKILEQINAKTVEFSHKVQTLREKLNEVKDHVRQTKKRLNSLHQYLD